MDEAPDPTGPFSSFLSIQSVIITGYIDTPRSDQGLISYSTDLYYHFSCRYPLEYLINNTQIVAWVPVNLKKKSLHCAKRDIFSCWLLQQVVNVWTHEADIYIQSLSFPCFFSSSVSVATSDNNGTFIDTLKMGVFNVSTKVDSAALYTL